MPRLCVVGLSHKTAPIELRERVAIPEGGLSDALKRLTGLPGVREAMILSTCNRVEIYASLDESIAVELLMPFLSGSHAEVEKALYRLEGDEALRHVFKVTASLDSMVIGESQILGQVKEAYALAVAAQTVGPVLQKTLPRAFQLAKRVRTETDVAKSSASIASAAVDLAEQIFGKIAGRSVLCVGAGKMGDLSARHLKSAGVGPLHVVNRTLSRAEALADKLGGHAAPWSDLESLLAKVDIVLCSTGATEPVITAEQVSRVMRARKGRWLFFIDIAVPRDVHADVGQIENVYLYDVDTLEKVVSQNLEGRERAADQADKILLEELARFVVAERHQGVVPVIKALRGHFEQVARAEVERALAKVHLDDRARAQVAQIGDAIVNKLLHAPLTALKRTAGDEQADGEALAKAVRELFALDRLEVSAERSEVAEVPASEAGEVPAKEAGKGSR